MKRSAFLLFPFFFTHGFVVTPQERLSGIEKTKLKSIDKKKRRRRNNSLSLFLEYNYRSKKGEHISEKDSKSHNTII